MTHCYYFGTSSMSFSAARSRCQSMGAELASIHDQQEDNFVSGKYNKCIPYV